MTFASRMVIVAVVCLWAGSAVAQWTWTPQTGRFVNVKRLPKETPELQIEHIRSLKLQGDYRQALRETNKFRNFYSDSDFADDNQFLRGEINYAQGNYMTAASEYQQMLASHPDSDLYTEALARQYEIGDRLYEIGVKRLDTRVWRPLRGRPMKRAITVYTMVVENQPFTPQAAEAQYKIGLCHYARKDYIEAAFEYRRVVEDYPDSEWVQEASYGLAMCYFEGSLSPDYDQTPAKLALSAVDDFAVRYPTDPRVGELQEVREEMRETLAESKLRRARFYERRREFVAAKLYYQQVVKDYPGTPAAERASSWLDANPQIPQPGSRRFADAEGRFQ